MGQAPCNHQWQESRRRGTRVVCREGSVELKFRAPALLSRVSVPPNVCRRRQPQRQRAAPPLLPRRSGAVSSGESVPAGENPAKFSRQRPVKACLSARHHQRLSGQGSAWRTEGRKGSRARRPPRQTPHAESRMTAR